MSLTLLIAALATHLLHQTAFTNPQTTLARVTALVTILGDLGTSFVNLTNYFRGFGAAIMAGSIIYGAYIWMFAGDEQTRVGKAKVLIGTGVFAGVVVFLAPTLAVAIWNTFNTGTYINPNP